MSPGPRTLFDKLWDAHVVVAETDADEVMVSTMVHGHDARLESYLLLANLWRNGGAFAKLIEQGRVDVARIQNRFEPAGGQLLDLLRCQVDAMSL